MLSNLFLKNSIFSVFGILNPGVFRVFLWTCGGEGAH